MNCKKDNWIKKSFKEQISIISHQFWNLCYNEYTTKCDRNVNLLMNRVIRYTEYSIDDPKNAEHVEGLKILLSNAKRYKDDYNNTKLEHEIEDYFSKVLGCPPSYKKKDVEEDEVLFIKVLDGYFNSLPHPTDTVMSIVQFDKDEQVINTFTDNYLSTMNSIDGFDQYYYRLATMSMNTLRDRVSDTHFGVKTSCVGGLSFDMADYLNRFLNYVVREYKKALVKGEEFNFDYSTISGHYLWFADLIDSIKIRESGFNDMLDAFLSKYSDFEEVTDLNEYRGVSGIYLLVLDNYSIAYLGQAVNVTERIMRHWSRSDYFTGLGIDAFKAFDTTRIYVCKNNTSKLNKMEYSMLKEIPKMYALNMLTGGDVAFHEENNIPLIEVKHQSIGEMRRERISTKERAIEAAKNFILEDKS